MKQSREQTQEMSLISARDNAGGGARYNLSFSGWLSTCREILDAITVFLFFVVCLFLFLCVCSDSEVIFSFIFFSSGIHNYGPQHLDEAVSFLSRTCEKYPYKELFSQPYKLADFETALVLSLQQTFYRICVEP